MHWKSLFTPAKNLTAEDAKRYIREHGPDSFTLLDVRQPGEYEESHIPGATLVPLPQLSERIQDLDRGKPVIAY